LIDYLRKEERREKRKEERKKEKITFKYLLSIINLQTRPGS